MKTVKRVSKKAIKKAIRKLRIARARKKLVKAEIEDPNILSRKLQLSMATMGMLCIVFLLKFNDHVLATKALDCSVEVCTEEETTREPVEYTAIEISDDELLLVPTEKAKMYMPYQGPDMTPEVETLPEENPDYVEEEEEIVVYGRDSYDLDSVLNYMYQEAEANGIPALILESIAWRESNFDYNAVSSTADHGMMQINECNFGWLRNEGVTDWYNPYESVDGAILIINKLRTCMSSADANNWHLVLMAYNMGLGGAQYQWSNGVYSSEYSRTIISHAKELGWTE